MTEESVARLQAKIAALRANRDEWMDRSNAHALEADRFRGEIVNLKGNLWAMERDIKAKDIVLQCARQELNKADKLNAELADRKPTLTDAADEIERLLIGGGMRQTDAEYRDEIARLRLTDEEREAVEVALVWVNPKRQSTLRGLLERLGQCKT
jgi:chromosome segregation ATPase